MASFSEGINAASSLLQLAPAILQLMAAIEAIFKPAKKPGDLKKSVVMAAVPTHLQEQASAFVDTTVKAANAAGVDLSSGAVNLVKSAQ